MVQPGLPGLEVPDLVTLTDPNTARISGEFRDEDDGGQPYDDLWEALVYSNSQLDFAINYCGAVHWLTVEFKDVDKERFSCAVRLTLNFPKLAALLPADLAASFGDAARIAGHSLENFRLVPVLKTGLVGRLMNDMEKTYTSFKEVEQDRRWLKDLKLVAADKDGLVTIVFQSLSIADGTFRFSVTGNASGLARAAHASMKQRTESRIESALADIQRKQQEIAHAREVLSALDGKHP